MNEHLSIDLAPYFVAEAGVNHDGNLETAKELIEVAAESGADAVKFQTFDTDRLVSTNAATATYQQERTGEQTQREMLQQYELDRSEHETLLEVADSIGIDFLSTPFDADSAAMLADLGVPAIKIGSGELTNHPLLESVASLGRPMIVSTGMATLSEVEAARDVIRDVAPDIDLSLLHCTSAYPTATADVNLRAMETMESAFPERIGYSDHTLHPETPALAVAAGATIVEKHFTLDSSLSGPDHEMSLEPADLKKSVDLARRAWEARGDPEKKPTDAEAETRRISRRSLYAATDIPEGTELSESHVDVLRPLRGLSPTLYANVLGRRTTRSIEADEALTAEDIEGELPKAER